jgi:hypothetical protein
MKPNELNRDIKRLHLEIRNNASKMSSDDFFEYLENTAKIEFKRLFRADDTFEYLSKDSILRMIQMNLTWRIIPFHQFGLGIHI